MNDTSYKDHISGAPFTSALTVASAIKAPVPLFIVQVPDTWVN